MIGFLKRNNLFIKEDVYMYFWEQYKYSEPLQFLIFFPFNILTLFSHQNSFHRLGKGTPQKPIIEHFKLSHTSLSTFAGPFQNLPQAACFLTASEIISALKSCVDIMLSHKNRIPHTSSQIFVFPIRIPSEWRLDMHIIFYYTHSPFERIQNRLCFRQFLWMMEKLRLH